ncbi:MAG TPA: hypothetical protein VKT49_06235 [Bryobacteraceae bacterium]|nr:hypothetical protein [Bryobacteraceae bacterium]
MDQIYESFQDHACFCQDSLLVETEARTLVPMRLSPGQLRLRQAIVRQQQRGQPVRIIYLKSRRIQATTGTAAEFFHATAFVPGVHTVALAHDGPSAEKIFAIYRRFYDQYRPFGGILHLPQGRALRDRIYFAHGHDPHSSFIQVHTAGNINFGRSFRITNLHFSEFPYYADSAATRAAAMSAVPKTADTSVIIEGTAKTIGDDFHQIWQAAADHSGGSEWLGLFLGWWEHPDNRMPPPVALEQFANTVTREERDLMEKFGLSFAQLAWRRYTIRSDFRGDLQAFQREHPATPEQAFTAASRNRFSIPDIDRMPIQRQATVGELELSNVGADKLLRFVAKETGPLRIYHPPVEGRLYACGADPSGGADANRGRGQADPDWAVGQILDRDTGQQCATLRLRCMPGEFGRYIYKLCRFYNHAQVALERTGAGVGSLEALCGCDYPSGLIYHRPVAGDQDPLVRSDRMGWNTDEVSRQQLISALDETIRQGSIWVHDPTTIQELLWFVINPRGRAEAQPGCHDDCVMALALAVVVLARMPRPTYGSATPAPRIGRYGRPANGEVQSRGQIVKLIR